MVMIAKLVPDDKAEMYRAFDFVSMSGYDDGYVKDLQETVSKIMYLDEAADKLGQVEVRDATELFAMAIRKSAQVITPKEII